MLILPWGNVHTDVKTSVMTVGHLTYFDRIPAEWKTHLVQRFHGYFPRKQNPIQQETGQHDVQSGLSLWNSKKDNLPLFRFYFVFWNDLLSSSYQITFSDPDFYLE